MAMPMISSRSALRSSRRVFSSGISSRHGPHQVAQKLTMTGRPFQSLSERDTPSRSGSGMSGSVSGIARRGGASASSPSARRASAAGAARRRGSERLASVSAYRHATSAASTHRSAARSHATAATATDDEADDDSLFTTGCSTAVSDEVADDADVAARERLAQHRREFRRPSCSQRRGSCAAPGPAGS